MVGSELWHSWAPSHITKGVGSARWPACIFDGSLSTHQCVEVGLPPVGGLPLSLTSAFPRAFHSLVVTIDGGAHRTLARPKHAGTGHI